MNKQITKKQYIIIDLIIMAVIVCVLETASRLALNFFKDEMFTISIVLPVTLIAMMRHGAPGVVLASVGGLIYCILNGAQANVYLIYIIGNSFIAANLIWLSEDNKHKIAKSTALVALYVFTGYLFINLGRSLCSLMFEASEFWAITVRYFTTDALSAVMSFVIIMIARKQDGVFEDQMQYLKRMADEEEANYAK